jgi:hypothetical protein
MFATCCSIYFYVFSIIFFSCSFDFLNDAENYTLNCYFAFAMMASSSVNPSPVFEDTVATGNFSKKSDIYSTTDFDSVDR